MTLFFSQQFTNCNICHRLKPRPAMEGETFSHYAYHNIGTPENVELRKVNRVAAGFVDDGLLANPAVDDDPQQAGRCMLPTLRNLGVTGPCIHNGVFEDLSIVALFYAKDNSRSAKRQTKPETGEHWAV